MMEERVSRCTDVRRWLLTHLLVVVGLLSFVPVGGQEFHNLTAAEVRIDSLLPLFTHCQPLGSGYADSTYTVSIDYPEFIDMTAADVARYHAISTDTLPALPVPEVSIGVSRKQASLYVSFVPLVCRDGRMQKLVSFKLTVKSAPRSAARARRRQTETGERYAAHSVLASGQWAKIRVPQTGIYQISEALVRQCGFTDINKVKVYGYGGALQPETVDGDYLASTDDLREVPTCNVGGRRLFRAVGPVSWQAPTSTARTLNPYSSHGYYFLTQGGDEPQTVDSTAFAASFYPSADDYHSLSETDDYAWFEGGRNLYNSHLITSSQPYTTTLSAAGTSGRLTVVLTYNEPFEVAVELNDSLVRTIRVTSTPDKYSEAAVVTTVVNITGLFKPQNTVRLRYLSGGDIRPDYVACYSDVPQPLPSLTTGVFATPEYVYRITNQDHHADGPADMVIIIPTSQKLMAQARRLADYHEQKEGMRVTIVSADELFNEFSSGTPDANAFRRYMKMLYDRADTEADMPKYLVMFGDGVWDNRMLTPTWRNASADDYLLCFESENSFSETDCYVSDDFFCMLDDGEGGSLLASDKADVAVGRFPVTTDAEAKVMVDKTISYMNNEQAGPWQNVICIMGDDGNETSDQNTHMATADHVYQQVHNSYPGFNVKKVYWDAYTRTTSSTGNRYPDVERILKQQMQAGALIMNYCGHGAPYSISHESVLGLSDFAASTSLRMPLWFTASCDIMPFDGSAETIGETAVLNKNGGAVAFFGTTRTVFTTYNEYMNLAFMRHVLSTVDGRRVPVGEAARLSKVEMITTGKDLRANKLQYTLLGDPALVLAAPTGRVVVDAINDQPAGGDKRVSVGAGSLVSVRGHIEGDATFNGVLTASVLDAEETIVCKMNNRAVLDTAFVFTDRPNTIFNGSDSVRNGQFAFTFAVPKDIKYSEGTGRLVLYALSSDKQTEAHGYNESFCMNADSLSANDGLGPSIYCYLNTPSFTNGGTVNATPYFYATLSDHDGINASGSGIGHDLELCVDGELLRTYVLNEYFQYDFGDYRSGSVGYSLPELAEGPHTLQFRAWDIFNNSSTAELAFNVSKSLQPRLLSVDCTQNPAVTGTTFIVSHDLTGSPVDLQLDVFDATGRLLWQHAETGVAATGTLTIDWDLCTDGGRRLQTGVYLYRVSVSSGGSRQSSKARKLIVMRK